MKSDQSIIKVSALTKIYDNDVRVKALDNVTFSVKDGDFLAINGASGSGKSTLLSLIGTLDIPTSGNIEIFGVNTNTLKGDKLANFRLKNIGFIFQSFHLVPALTALENVMIPLIPFKRGISFNLQARAKDLLIEMGLGTRLMHLPSQLSGGEQQRVAIARALVNFPKIILADEPTGNLDSVNGQKIFSILKKLCQETKLTVLMVTHNKNLAEQSTRMIWLKDGKIVS